MSETIVGYIGVIREIELGWGDRPDGFVLAKSKEDIESFVKESKAFNPRNSEYSVLDNIVFCQLSELAGKEITESESNTVWIPNQMKNEYILKY